MKNIFKFINRHRLLLFSVAFSVMMLMQNILVYAGEQGAAAAAEPGFPVKKLIIALVVGLVAAAIVDLIFRGELTSVETQREARNYVRKDSFKLFVKKDIYLYSDIKREEIKREQPKGPEGGPRRP